MEREPNEIVRTAIDAANRGDVSAIDALWSEDAEFHSTFAASEGRTFRGHQGIREYFATIADAFDGVEIDIEAIEPGTEERLLVLLLVSGRGVTSGVPVEHRYGQVWTVSGGRVRSVESHLDPGDARAAAGLGAAG
jgi:ketosteroid isomerase-like protein